MLAGILTVILTCCSESFHWNRRQVLLGTTGEDCVYVCTYFPSDDVPIIYSICTQGVLASGTLLVPYRGWGTTEAESKDLETTRFVSGFLNFQVQGNEEWNSLWVQGNLQAKRKRKERIRKQRIMESTVLKKLTKETRIANDRWVSMTQWNRGSNLDVVSDQGGPQKGFYREGIYDPKGRPLCWKILWPFEKHQYVLRIVVPV